ncbi:MAG: choice-of-anchor Q domain-containing protein, partial [Thermoanaerobaculia bacterium]
GTNGFAVPPSTPFVLRGSAIDAEGDTLTFSWEELDLPPQPALVNSGVVPFFRVFEPSQSPSRIFPQISDVIAGIESPGEQLPASAQSLTVRLHVYDNFSGAGGVAYAETTVDVAPQTTDPPVSPIGPFLVTSPNAGSIVWQPGTTQTVTWDVANSHRPPIGCGTVDIHLSTDGGSTYPLPLATGVPNGGSRNVSVPAVATSKARVRVACASWPDHFFFDVSNADFRIYPPPPAGCVTGLVVRDPRDNGPCTLRDTVANAPAGSIITFDPSLQGATLGLATEIVIAKNLTIDGQDRGIVLSGGGQTRVVSITAGNVTIRSLTIRDGDVAPQNGGGLQVISGASARIEDSLLLDNNALKSSTVYANDSMNGGGTYLATMSQLQLANTLIGGSSRGEDCLSDGSAVVTDGGSNLVEDSSCGFSGGTDPKLGPLQDNGGSAPTHALLPGSPAIDAGNATICASPEVGLLDQRGHGRPAGLCDIGSYELGGTSPAGAPQITPISLAVNEGSPIGTVVGTVPVSSGCAPGCGPRSFRIDGGDPDGIFTIDDGGQISVRQSRLDFDLSTQFQLVVTVVDAADPSLADSEVVTVNVNDVNSTRDRSLPTVSNPATPTSGRTASLDEEDPQMKSRRMSPRAFRKQPAGPVSILAAVLALSGAISPVAACIGDPPPPVCAKTLALAIAGPPTLLADGGAFDVEAVVVFQLLDFPQGTGSCPAGPYAADLEVTATCDPAGDGAGQLLGVEIMPGFNTFNIPVTMPAGTPRRCVLEAVATVALADGMTLSDTAGGLACLGAPDPVFPQRPRLDLRRIGGTAVARVHPGDQFSNTFRVANNDPGASFSGTLVVESVNESRRPAASGPMPAGTGVFAISDPVQGDNFPLAFAEDLFDGCVALPPDPLTAGVPSLTRDVVLGPGESVDVPIFSRSWGLCADGSCSRTVLELDGEFSDESAATGCASFVTAADSGAEATYLWRDAGRAARFILLDPPILNLLAVPIGKGPVLQIDAETTQVSWAVNGQPATAEPLVTSDLIDVERGRTLVEIVETFAVDAVFDGSIEVTLTPTPGGQPLVVESFEAALTGGPTDAETTAPGARIRMGLFEPFFPLRSNLDIVFQVHAVAVDDAGERRAIRFDAVELEPAAGGTGFNLQLSGGSAAPGQRAHRGRDRPRLPRLQLRVASGSPDLSRRLRVGRHPPVVPDRAVKHGSIRRGSSPSRAG